MVRRKSSENMQAEARRPAKSLAEREDQLIALATDRAEEMLRDGTAPASVIVHYLKAGSTRDKLEKAKIERETEMLRAKQSAIESGEEVQDLIAKALDAFTSYAPVQAGDSDD